MQTEAEFQRLVPRLTPDERRRFLRTRIIAIEGERDRLEGNLEFLRREIYQRNKDLTDPKVIDLVDQLNATHKRWSALNAELRDLYQRYNGSEEMPTCLPDAIAS